MIPNWKPSRSSIWNSCTRAPWISASYILNQSGVSLGNIPSVPSNVSRFQLWFLQKRLRELHIWFHQDFYLWLLQELYQGCFFFVFKEFYFWYLEYFDLEFFRKFQLAFFQEFHLGFHRKLYFNFLLEVPLWFLQELHIKFLIFSKFVNRILFEISCGNFIWRSFYSRFEFLLCHCDILHKMYSCIEITNECLFKIVHESPNRILKFFWNSSNFFKKFMCWIRK